MLYCIGRVIIWIIYHIKFSIKLIGKENIPKKGGIIIASNHVSNFDPPMVGITFKGVCTFMAKEELFQKNKLFTWVLKHLHAYPIKRGARDSSGIDKALDGLKKGWNFVIFPEGTRSKTGELGKPKSGVSMVAAQAGVPVAPVFIRYGKKRAIRRKVLVSVGKLIPAEKFEINIEDRHEIHRISKMIMGEIIALKDNAPEFE